MQLYLRMHLKSDAIFGNGMSLPGGEDICVQTDEHGFPYLKGNTLKGIFREELINLLNWEGKNESEIGKILDRLMGESDSHRISDQEKLTFSDMELSGRLREEILEEKDITDQEIQSMFTYTRTFTSLEDGLAKEGSLRVARCIRKGLHFYGTCTCREEDRELTEEVLRLIKWVGSMRSRGFGKVKIESGSSC